MMNRLLLCIAATFAVVLQSCDKTDDLKAGINDLKDRVAALEANVVGTLNQDIVSLRRLMDASTVIVGLTPTEAGYRLELSDGTRLDIVLGQQVEALVPVLGIDDEGYWIFSLDQGETFRRLVSGGEPVLAYTEDASTPRVRIDADGYWEISADGSAWEPLLLDGQPVNAFSGNISVEYSGFFKDVRYDAATRLLAFELLTGGSLTLPVEDTFGVTIASAEEEEFLLGETRQFEVEQRSVAEALIEAPEGWRAVLEEKTLTVTAPRTWRGGEATALSVVVTSSKGYVKSASFGVKQLDREIDANACTAWRNFVAGSADNVLLDYSWAGYKHGEEAPADGFALGYKIYNILDYGADPTGKTSSRPAFIALLEELKLTGKNANGNNQSNATANAVIYFPEGEFILHDEADDTKRDTPLVAEGETIEYMSSDIIILGGNFVIKGAGRDKTKLVMKTRNYPATSDMWSSPMMINIKNNSSRIGSNYSALASVTEDAAKGTYSVTVGSTAGISAGAWVMLYLESTASDLVASEIAPFEASSIMTDIRTVCVYDYHQVKSVSGNTVTFYEPIMHAVDAKYGWEIREFPHYENVGIEDLTFVGDAKDQFGHHVSWEDDGAFKPLQMMRLTNSWIRRVDFESVSEALSIVSSANCSAYDIEITGRRGHSAVRSQGSSRVFIGKVNDRTYGYECVNSSGVPGSTLIQNAGQYHGTGVSNQSMGTVLWNNRWGDDAFFESHAKQPRATLVDRCTGGFVQWRFGGDDTNVPNHLGDLTLWNLENTKVKHDFGNNIFRWWLKNNRWWKVVPPIIVGFHGAESVNFQLKDEEGDKQLEYLESNGAAVEPLSLYEAQLRERLGYVPAWLNYMK
ncbi:MAG: DUF4955 domain-containing protein [Alistipes sp.]|nr:DUF4955 domain-containing protein [Alistipes sp.]